MYSRKSQRKSKVVGLSVVLDEKARVLFVILSSASLSGAWGTREQLFIEELHNGDFNLPHTKLFPALSFSLSLFLSIYLSLCLSLSHTHT